MFESYRVLPGDSLTSIAKKFNTSVKVLQDINNMYYTDDLRQDMELIVPKETQEYFNYYVVEKGDRIFMGNNENQRLILFKCNNL